MNFDEVMRTPLNKMTDEQLEVLLENISEKEKDNLIRHIFKSLRFVSEIGERVDNLDFDVNTTIDSLINTLKVKNQEIDDLFNRLGNKELELLDKESIMQIFNCQSDKALKILKLMYANNFGCKIGKEYYITKNEFSKFMNIYKGKDLLI